MGKSVILASSSPRRRELLQNIGLPFKTIVREIDESITDTENPVELVELLATRKALAVAYDHDLAGELAPGTVIGADTVVVCDSRLLGKPFDDTEACEMLNLLQGRTHDVLTGVALVDLPSGEKIVFHEKTEVAFRRVSMREINDYVATGEPSDKAGAYGIQGRGSIFVAGIRGCYFNVVGLPICKLTEGLKKFGISILNDQKHKVTRR